MNQPGTPGNHKAILAAPKGLVPSTAQNSTKLLQAVATSWNFLALMLKGARNMGAVRLSMACIEIISII